MHSYDIFIGVLHQKTPIETEQESCGRKTAEEYEMKEELSKEIDEIVLRHTQRGMHILRDHQEKGLCESAAKEILSWEKDTVLLATGFYVAGYAETDGPAGTMVEAKALKALGYHPVVVTDSFCRGFFELEDIDAEYLPMDADDADCLAVVEKYHPVGMISIERCGKNIQDDYANMRGISILENTAPVDRIFELVGPDAAEGAPRVRTIGVGDGGNEIGMGNLADVITKDLSLVPCRVRTDILVTASVSNWGAYGIAAALQALTGEKVYSLVDGKPVDQKVEEYIQATVEIGSVDGVTHERVAHVDGYEAGVEQEILKALAEAVDAE